MPTCSDCAYVVTRKNRHLCQKSSQRDWDSNLNVMQPIDPKSDACSQFSGPTLPKETWTLKPMDTDPRHRPGIITSRDLKILIGLGYIHPAVGAFYAPFPEFCEMDPTQWEEDLKRIVKALRGSNN